MAINVDITPELTFLTARSGGKGGQNVNKVETSVTARFQAASSAILSEEQKARVLERLAARISQEGWLSVRSQAARTQLANKAESIRKINALVNVALEVRRKRIKSKPGKAAVEKRLRLKQRLAEKKKNRRIQPE